MRTHISRRKNYLPGLVLTVALWVFAVFIFLSIPPSSVLIIGIFITIFITAVFLTSSLLLGNSRNGLFIVLAILVLVILKRLDMLTLLSGIIVFALLFTLNLLFKRDK
ncbi:hypothetical protein HYT02_05085 [Candidatus Gottesmanbacteria bacterium]|nr:hypothetical protein [Candidatus Gottesmanbacteria bacterium]